MEELFKAVKKASRGIALLSDETRSQALRGVADAIMANMQRLLEANASDLSRMDKASPLYDRLMLTEKRIEAIAGDMRSVAGLPCPLGRTLLDKTLPNGLRLRKTSVPFGVIGVIYEARPNVTFDVFSLCMKSGNACILKGGKDADDTNRVAISIIKDTLSSMGISPDAAELLPATHDASLAMLSATGYVDVVIPRGGRRLIDFVRDNAKVPCIETGAGVVNAYFDKYGNLEIGKAIVLNAKTRRVSVCNALDCLLVHKDRLSDLKELCAPLAAKNVLLYADQRAFQALDGSYPMLSQAIEESFGTEYMDYKMAIRTVDSLDEALSHIERYGSGHSESIITDNGQNAAIFQQSVDAACVYVNTPTSFTDGGQFGLGAEIGISTQKLGARGPMGLEEMTTYKWLINGYGQTRP